MLITEQLVKDSFRKAPFAPFFKFLLKLFSSGKETIVKCSLDFLVLHSVLLFVFLQFTSVFGYMMVFD